MKHFQLLMNMWFGDSILHLPKSLIGPLTMVIMLLFWIQISVLVFFIRNRIVWWKNLYIILTLIFEYLFFQMILGTRFKGERAEWCVNILSHISYLTFLAIVILMGIVLILSLMDYKKWKRTHITNMSIKESMDILPDGVVIYSSEGMPLLINPAMESISNKCFGKPLINGIELEEKLETLLGKKLSEEGQVIKLSENDIYMVKKSIIYIEKIECRELIMSDVRDEYIVNSLLEKENRRLASMNRRLSNLNKIIDEVTIDSEILDAKVQVHDYLGQVLIATKSYMQASYDIDKDETNTDENREKKLLEMWQESIMFFRDLGKKEKKDELQQLMSIADDVGVKILLSGVIPQDKDIRHVFVTAMHECLTNTIRHAGGDELYVRVGESSINIKNNGSPPVKGIVESGGLASLRQLVENQGGEMNISSDMEFELEIVL